MFPFRSQPHAIDQVICANCGKAAWDHFISAAGAECDGPRANQSCRYFSPTFTALPERPVEHRVHQPH